MDICPNCKIAMPPIEDKALRRDYQILKVHLEAAEAKLEELGYKKEYIKHGKPCLETIWVKKDV